MSEQLDVKKLLANSPTNNREFSMELKSRINGRVATKRVRKVQLFLWLPVVNAAIAVVLVGGVVQFAHHSIISHNLPPIRTVANRPGVSGQSAGNPIYVRNGNWYRVGNLNVMVNKQMFAGTLRAGDNELPAGKGQHWVSLNLTIKNMSASPLILTSSMFDLNYNDVYHQYSQVQYPVSARGNTYIPDSIVGKVLQPGQLVKGVVVFEVPSSIWWDVAFHVKDKRNPNVLFFVG